MSAMVISSVEVFSKMSKRLEDIGISNIHFYNSKSNKELSIPMIALMPFMDFVILGKDTHCSSSSYRQVILEAQARDIPVITQECIDDLMPTFTSSSLD